MDTVIDRTQYKYDIFISYSKHDKDFVKPLVRELKLYGYRIWRDRDMSPEGRYVKLGTNDSV